MGRIITAWRITAATLTLLMAGGISWLALGERDPQVLQFVEYVSSLPKEQVIKYTAEAHAYAGLCGWKVNRDTDQIVYKAAGIRRSKLAKDATIHAQFETAYDALTHRGENAPSKESFCDQGLTDYGSNGVALKGMLMRPR